MLRDKLAAFTLAVLLPIQIVAILSDHAIQVGLTTPPETLPTGSIEVTVIDSLTGTGAMESHQVVMLSRETAEKSAEAITNLFAQEAAQPGAIVQESQKGLQRTVHTVQQRNPDLLSKLGQQGLQALGEFAISLAAQAAKQEFKPEGVADRTFARQQAEERDHDLLKHDPELKALFRAQTGREPTEAEALTLGEELRMRPDSPLARAAQGLDPDMTAEFFARLVRFRQERPSEDLLLQLAGGTYPDAFLAFLGLLQHEMKPEDLDAKDLDQTLQATVERIWDRDIMTPDQWDETFMSSPKRLEVDGLAEGVQIEMIADGSRHVPFTFVGDEGLSEVMRVFAERQVPAVGLEEEEPGDFDPAQMREMRVAQATASLVDFVGQLHATPGTVHLVAKDAQGATIGLAIAAPDPKKEGALYVNFWGIHPDWEHKGIGGALRDQLFALAASEEITQPDGDAYKWVSAHVRRLPYGQEHEVEPAEPNTPGALMLGWLKGQGIDITDAKQAGETLLAQGGFRETGDQESGMYHASAEAQSQGIQRVDADYFGIPVRPKAQPLAGTETLPGAKAPPSMQTVGLEERITWLVSERDDLEQAVAMVERAEAGWTQADFQRALKALGETLHSARRLLASQEAQRNLPRPQAFVEDLFEGIAGSYDRLLQVSRLPIHLEGTAAADLVNSLGRTHRLFTWFTSEASAFLARRSPQDRSAAAHFAQQAQVKLATQFRSLEALAARVVRPGAEGKAHIVLKGLVDAEHQMRHFNDQVARWMTGSAELTPAAAPMPLVALQTEVYRMATEALDDVGPELKPTARVLLQVFLAQLPAVHSAGRTQPGQFKPVIENLTNPVTLENVNCCVAAIRNWVGLTEGSRAIGRTETQRIVQAVAAELLASRAEGIDQSTLLFRLFEARPPVSVPMSIIPPVVHNLYGYRLAGAGLTSAEGLNRIGTHVIAHVRRAGYGHAAVTVKTTPEGIALQAVTVIESNDQRVEVARPVYDRLQSGYFLVGAAQADLLERQGVAYAVSRQNLSKLQAQGPPVFTQAMSVAQAQAVAPAAPAMVPVSPRERAALPGKSWDYFAGRKRKKKQKRESEKWNRLQRQFQYDQSQWLATGRPLTLLQELTTFAAMVSQAGLADNNEAARLYTQFSSEDGLLAVIQKLNAKGYEILRAELETASSIGALLQGETLVDLVEGAGLVGVLEQVSVTAMEEPAEEVKAVQAAPGEPGAYGPANFIVPTVRKLAGTYLSGGITRVGLEEYVRAIQEMAADFYGWKGLAGMEEGKIRRTETGDLFLHMPNGRSEAAADCFELTFAAMAGLEEYGAKPQMLAGYNDLWSNDVVAGLEQGGEWLHLSFVPGTKPITAAGLEQSGAVVPQKNILMGEAQQLIELRRHYVGLTKLRPISFKPTRGGGGEYLLAGLEEQVVSPTLGSEGKQMVLTALVRRVADPEGENKVRDRGLYKVTVPVRAMTSQGELKTELQEALAASGLEEAVAQVGGTLEVLGPQRLNDDTAALLRNLLQKQYVPTTPVPPAALLPPTGRGLRPMTSENRLLAQDIFNLDDGFAPWALAVGTPANTFLVVPGTAQLPDQAEEIFARMRQPALATRMILFGSRWAGMKARNRHLRVIPSDDINALMAGLEELPKGATVRILGAGEGTPLLQTIKERVEAARHLNLNILPFPLQRGLRAFFLRLGQALGVPQGMVQERVNALVRRFLKVERRQL